MFLPNQKWKRDWNGGTYLVNFKIKFEIFLPEGIKFKVLGDFFKFHFGEFWGAVLRSTQKKSASLMQGISISKQESYEMCI